MTEELREKLKGLDQVQESVRLARAKYIAAAKQEHPTVSWLVKKFLPGYTLHKNPEKGQRRKPRVQEPITGVGTVEERIEAGKGLSLAYPEKGE